MAILVTGAGGQLGRALCRAAGARPLCALTRAQLDITDAAAVHTALRRHRARLVINAAAWTDVDGAERAPQAAFAVNRDGAAHLAEACAAAGIPLFHVSTDHVFDGRRAQPWREDDAVAPLGVYGASKYAGECEVRRRLEAHLILRTSWLFAATGGNFVHTVLRWARTQAVVRVVAAHVGRPTPAVALAAALLQLADRHLAGEALPWGLYHFSGTPPVSRLAFAEAVVAEAQACGLLAQRPLLQPLPLSEWPGAALRPANACLDGARAQAVLGLAPPPWRPALAALLRELRNAP